MSRHTAGPWSVKFRADGSCYIVMGSLHGSQHKQFDLALDRGQYNDEDDASLIAAAPELLEACELALAYWYSDHPNDTVEAHEARERIRAAITRATPPLPTMSEG